MAEIRINATGGVKLYDADDSHYAQIIAGTITSNTDVMTLGHNVIDIPMTTASSSATTGALTIGGGLGVAADLYVGDDTYLITDSAVLGFGADKDTTLTHTDGTGLTLNSTNKLCFNDATQFVQGSSGTVLSIGATDEIDLTATAVDLNGTLDVSGTSLLTGRVGVVTAGDLGSGLHVRVSDSGASADSGADDLVIETSGGTGLSILSGTSSSGDISFGDSGDNNIGRVVYSHSDNKMRLVANATNVAYFGSAEVVFNEDSGDMDFRVETNGNANTFFVDGGSDWVAVGKNNGTTSNVGNYFSPSSENHFTTGDYSVLVLNRQTDDGSILDIKQANSQEGSISVSGTTVAYGTFCGAHWSRLANNSKPTILRGTVMESIATMMDWYQAVATDDDESKISEDIALPNGKSVGDAVTFTSKGKEYTGVYDKEDNEQLPMCKISDTEDSKGVYGVFMAWDDHDDGLDGDVNDMYIAALGAFVVRVHSGETVAIGDYLQSKGDGTAKVQADDILRASTIAKVTSTTKTITHGDGSYCVPCTLHCG